MFLLKALLHLGFKSHFYRIPTHPKEVSNIRQRINHFLKSDMNLYCLINTDVECIYLVQIFEFENKVLCKVYEGLILPLLLNLWSEDKTFECFYAKSYSRQIMH